MLVFSASECPQNSASIGAENAKMELMKYTRPNYLKATGRGVISLGTSFFSQEKRRQRPPPNIKRG